MLRLIAGKYRGRKLAVPEGLGVRPTTDRMRERIFSMLNHPRYPDLLDARVADFFAGTGALGLEALSRGAGHVTFIELNAQHVKQLESNIKTLKAADDVTVLRMNATHVAAAQQAYDFIFMDPPYHKGLLPQALNSALEYGWVKDNTTIIAECGSDEIPDLPTPLQIVDERVQGKQKILFIQKSD